MPSDTTSPALRRWLRVATLLCLAVVAGLALVVPSESLRTGVVTFLVVVGLVWAGWRLSGADDERTEPLPADD